MALPTRSPVSTLGQSNDPFLDPAGDFAAKAVALNALARQILEARAIGDEQTVTTLRAQMRATLGADDLATVAAQAKAADMPSDAMLTLASLGDAFTTFAKLAPWLLGLAVIGWWYVNRGRQPHA